MVGLFKRNKSKGFYLELDESETSTPQQPAVEQKPEPAIAQTTAETATVVAPAQATAETTTAVATAEASKPKSARQAKKEELAKAKAEAKAKKQAEAEAKKKAAAPEPTPVAAINSAAAVVNSKAKGQPETTFATKYVPMIMPRRRPGPSMNKFLDMAAQMQNPRF
ncbi:MULTISPECIES: hypothetical protein [Moorena]|uniref:Uncharacterized protein n=1 Tax=Moorena producens 3L TaxID=489825 RepID=F4XPR9_9CYAN|nr:MULTISPECIES: hypothetical protein [Moorena]NEQ17531.1 hypothetical protein [Moorena sp. SIO3E2]EGJ33523.1 hypothetical protein LYNGBM3L_34820 [Moorena producens 3L]NEP33574.1 hypothetical protein [Moorena sp. SIO3B2]NEP66860.1 hypothetical protein [Moorena sp. SIO3A5]NER91787.1 hypothetical protein [Moorena sp. SIO3A2]